MALTLYILRHAEAEDLAAMDAARRLTEKGVRQAEQVGRFCAEHGLRPELILCSPYVRTVQTAERVGAATGSPVQPEGWLASGMPPETALAELKAWREVEALMLTGHEPDLSLLIAHLLGLPSSGQVLVRKASLFGLYLPTLRSGTAQLLFSLPCRLM